MTRSTPSFSSATNSEVAVRHGDDDACTAGVHYQGNDASTDLANADLLFAGGIAAALEPEGVAGDYGFGFARDGLRRRRRAMRTAVAA